MVTEKTWMLTYHLQEFNAIKKIKNVYDQIINFYNR